MGSRRLPGKVLMNVRGVPLIQRVWSAACEAFGERNVVVAIPATHENAPLERFLCELGARSFAWDGPEDDVLGRFFFCAINHLGTTHATIVRLCADNPFLDPYKLRLTASGAQFSRREGGEAFTVGDLLLAHHDTPANDPRREHVTQAMPNRPRVPQAPARCWTIDTPDDLDRCNAFRTYVVDIDGTLCSASELPDPKVPRPDVIAAVNALYDAGHTIILDTARRATLYDRTAEQLAEWGVTYDQLRCGKKIPADVYVDDLSIRPEEMAFYHATINAHE